MAFGYGLPDVRHDIRDRVKALTATPYAQSPNGTATWRESKDVRGVLAGDSGPFSHLAFAVRIDDAPNTDRQNDSSNGEARVRASVVVEFLYNIRGQDWDDMDLAMRAAQDIAAAVLVNPNADYSVDLISAFRPRLLPDGKSVYVEVPFSVVLDLSLQT